MTMKPLSRLKRVSASDDAGFSLVEMIVAMLVFALLSASALLILDRSTNLNRSNAMRAVAANLAARQIEIVRSMDTHAIPDGLQTYAMSVEGKPFTVVQSASFVAVNSTTSTCDSVGGGSNISHKRVSVTVSWPAMGTTKPVRSDTLKAVGPAGLDPTKGTLAIRVVDRNSAPVPGATVTLNTGANQLTGDDGCAVFPSLTAATSYTATASLAGYVNKAGGASVMQTTPVVNAGAITRGTVVYLDRPTTASFVFAPAAGHALPSPLPMMMLHEAGVTPATATTRMLNPAVATSLSTLYPFATGYAVWAGRCTSAIDTNATFQAPQGTASVPQTVPVPLAPVSVTVRSKNNTAIAASSPVYALSGTGAGSDPGCPAGETYNLGTTGVDPAAPLQGSLPFGTWRLAVNSTGSTAGMGTATWISAPFTVSRSTTSGAVYIMLTV